MPRGIAFLITFKIERTGMRFDCKLLSCLNGKVLLVSLLGKKTQTEVDWTVIESIRVASKREKKELKRGNILGKHPFVGM